MLFDRKNDTEVRIMISPQAQTNSDTAIVSGIIDLQGCRAATVNLILGGVTDTDVTAVGLLEHGDNAALSDAATVPAADLIDGPTTALNFIATDDNKVKIVGYRGSKRYLRLTVTPTGNNSGTISLAATVSLGVQYKDPVA